MWHILLALPNQHLFINEEPKKYMVIQCFSNNSEVGFFHRCTTKQVEYATKYDSKLNHTTDYAYRTYIVLKPCHRYFYTTYIVLKPCHRYLYRIYTVYKPCHRYLYRIYIVYKPCHIE